MERQEVITSLKAAGAGAMVGIGGLWLANIIKHRRKKAIRTQSQIIIHGGSPGQLFGNGAYAGPCDAEILDGGSIFTQVGSGCVANGIDTSAVTVGGTSYQGAAIPGLGNSWVITGSTNSPPHGWTITVVGGSVTIIPMHPKDSAYVSSDAASRGKKATFSRSDASQPSDLFLKQIRVNGSAPVDCENCTITIGAVPTRERHR